jgi:hypothetical protein
VINQNVNELERRSDNNYLFKSVRVSNLLIIFWLFKLIAYITYNLTHIHITYNDPVKFAQKPIYKKTYNCYTIFRYQITVQTNSNQFCNSQPVFDLITKKVFCTEHITISNQDTRDNKNDGRMLIP